MREAVALLTGPRAPELLQTALTGQVGGTVPGFRCAVDRVHDRIGAETSVTYHVSYGEDGQTTGDYLVATTADIDAAAAAASVQVGGLTVRVWRHPSDPRLPGLAGACTPEVLASWLPGDTSPTHDSTRVLVYRPLRRAVLRTERGEDTYFTKVVRTGPGELLVRRHTLLEGLGPDVVATPAPGVLVTARAPGTSLAVALSAWQLGESTVRPDPADALALLDRIPPGAVDLPVRRSWTERVDFHGPMAAAALPEHADDIELLTRQIQDLAERVPVGPVVPTHGDFYEGNLFCTDGVPTRMIDVDTVGPGRREDDLACMIAHLAALPAFSPRHYPRGAEVVQEWAEAFERTVDPAAFRIRVAGVLLSLVAATDRPQALTRLDLARAWAWRAAAAG